LLTPPPGLLPGVACRSIYAELSIVEFILNWQQRIVMGQLTDLPLNAQLPHWHDERFLTFLTIILLNNFTPITATCKLTDVATVVMGGVVPVAEEWGETVAVAASPKNK
jgi:hypothetical protein